jgi:hypothetical protein
MATIHPPQCHECHGPAPQWVRWTSAAGASYLFCDNDCLTWWIQQQREAVCAQIAVELREVAI